MNLVARATRRGAVNCRARTRLAREIVRPFCHAPGSSTPECVFAGFNGGSPEVFARARYGGGKFVQGSSLIIRREGKKTRPAEAQDAYKLLIKRGR